MDATILVNRTHRLPRKAIPQTLVEPEIIFDAPVGDRKRLLAVSAARQVFSLENTPRDSKLKHITAIAVIWS